MGHNCVEEGWCGFCAADAGSGIEVGDDEVVCVECQVVDWIVGDAGNGKESCAWHRGVGLWRVSVEVVGGRGLNFSWGIKSCGYHSVDLGYIYIKHVYCGC